MSLFSLLLPQAPTLPSSSPKHLLFPPPLPGTYCPSSSPKHLLFPPFSQVSNIGGLKPFSPSQHVFSHIYPPIYLRIYLPVLKRDLDPSLLSNISFIYLSVYHFLFVSINRLDPDGPPSLPLRRREGGEYETTPSLPREGVAPPALRNTLDTGSLVGGDHLPGEAPGVATTVRRSLGGWWLGPLTPRVMAVAADSQGDDWGC